MSSSNQMVLSPKITNIRSVKPYHAHVTIEPFERGFGHTLGNALRRIMMSSIPGYAPTEVKIENVVHEYDRVEGMREDVVWLLLNLKRVVFRVVGDERVVLRVKKSGEGAVTAGDIELPHNVEVLNPDHVLATLTRRGKLDMEIIVEKGVGYQAASVREELYRDIHGDGKRFGAIYLDALYSPVRRVAFQVENARVANRTNLDRLILDIETNGVLDFEEVIRKASQIMIEQLMVFARSDKQQDGLDGYVPEGAEDAETDHPMLAEEIKTTDLSVRSRNCLRKENIRYVGDLVRKTEKDLMKMPHLGRKSMVEIKQFLTDAGLHLGMDLPDWTPPSS